MPKVPSIAEELNTLFPAQWIRRAARKQVVVRRFVKVDIVVSLWTLLLGPPAEAFATLASLTPPWKPHPRNARQRRVDAARPRLHHRS